MGTILSIMNDNNCTCCLGTGKYPSYRDCYECYGTGRYYSITRTLYSIKESVHEKYIDYRLKKYKMII